MAMALSSTVHDKRTAVIERVGERKHAAARDEAVGRLQPDRAAIAGGPADRAAGVGAHRHAHEAGGDRRARSGRRAARDVIRIPRIARRRERQVERRAADGEFVRRELAEHHRALRLEFRGDDGILLRHVVDAAASNGRSCGCRPCRRCPSAHAECPASAPCRCLWRNRHRRPRRRRARSRASAVTKLLISGSIVLMRSSACSVSAIEVTAAAAEHCAGFGDRIVVQGLRHVRRSASR